MTGARGMGKSELAREVARRWTPRARSAESVLRVDLTGALTEAEAEARARGAFELPVGSPHSPVLSEVLGAWGTELIVLEGLERSLAEWALSLQSSAPELKLLLTTREPLDLPEASHLALAPLALTGNAARPAAAVQLLVDRILRFDSSFELGPQTSEALHDLASRVAGVPALLDLVAPRVVTVHAEARWANEGGLPAERVLKAAEEGLASLVTSLCDELDDISKEVLRRIASLEVAIDGEVLRLALADDDISASSVSSALERLIGDGLLVKDANDEHPLWRVPPIYREDVRRALGSMPDGEARAWREALACTLAEAGTRHLSRLFHDGGASHRWLRASHPIMLAAADWTDEPDTLLALGRAEIVSVFDIGTLGPFADRLASRRASLGADAAPSIHAELRLLEARARMHLGQLGRAQGLIDEAAAEPSIGEATTLECALLRATIASATDRRLFVPPLEVIEGFRRIGDAVGEWRAYNLTLEALYERGEVEVAREHRSRMLQLVAEADATWRVRTFSSLAQLELQRRADHEAGALLDKAQPLVPRGGRHTALVMWTVTAIQRVLSRRPRALVNAAFQEALAAAAGFGSDYFRLELLASLVGAACLHGDRAALNSARLLRVAFADHGRIAFDADILLRSALAEALFGDVAIAEELLHSVTSSSAIADADTIELDRRLVEAALRRRAGRDEGGGARDLEPLKRALEASRAQPFVLMQRRITERLATMLLDHQRIDESDPAMLLEPRAFVVATEERWCRPPDGPRIALRRKAAQLLVELAREAEEGGAGLSGSDLVARLWSGDEVDERSAKNRLRVAIAELRSLGLRRWILTDADRYRLSPEAIVRWV